MHAILTSSLGGYAKVDGRRVPEPLPRTNGLLDRVRSFWPENTRVLIICADPAEHENNDDVRSCFQQTFPLSGLRVSSVGMCDDRDPGAAERLGRWDVLVLTGGHVPTQNRFLKALGLRERLADFQGLLLAWSAGSMNCADTVYAGPELPGEAVDPRYARWITGLGITDINIFPHMQSLRDAWLDGMRLVEDITFADSVGHTFLALNDGSYIVIDGGRTTLYGEAYRIRNRRITRICEDGQAVRL